MIDPHGHEPGASQAAKEGLARHRERWGEGPPFYSPATTDLWNGPMGEPLRIARCTACEHRYFPPRVVCPACWEEDRGELIATDGQGTVRSWTSMHVVWARLQPIAPVGLALVDLDAGPALLAVMRDGLSRSGERCVVRLDWVAQELPGAVARPARVVESP